MVTLISKTDKIFSKERNKTKQRKREGESLCNDDGQGNGNGTLFEIHVPTCKNYKPFVGSSINKE